MVAISTIGLNGTSYIYKTFSLSYLAEFRDVAANVGAFGISLASAAAIVTVPLAGRFCDAIGTRQVMLLGAGCIAALAYPFFWLLNTDQPVYIWLALILTVGIVQTHAAGRLEVIPGQAVPGRSPCVGRVRRP